MHLACNHPCSLTSQRKLTKLPPWTGEQLNHKAEGTLDAFPLGGVRGHFVQSRVEFSHLIVLCIRCCVRTTNTSVLTVSINIAFNALHALIFVSTVSTNKIPYSMHNSIALILCINYLDMPFNVNKVTMMTMSGFLTISFEVGVTVIQTLNQREF